MRERTYFAQLCLLQISDGERALRRHAGTARSRAAAPGADRAPAPRKVLHAARQDLEVLWPANRTGRRLFDTQVAAALIGMPAQIGYGDLVQQLLGQTPAQGRDAHRLVAPPAERPRRSSMRWTTCVICCRCESACTRACSSSAAGRGSWRKWRELDAAGSFAADPEQAWRRVKGVTRTGRRAPVAGAGAGAWRERRAISADRPRSWILPDAALRDIVMRAPRSMRASWADRGAARGYPQQQRRTRCWQ